MYDFYENDFVYLYRIVFNVESINIFNLDIMDYQV